MFPKRDKAQVVKARLPVDFNLNTSMICDILEVQTEFNQNLTENGLHDDTVFNYERGEVMRITDVICCSNHKNEKHRVNDLVSFSES